MLTWSKDLSSSTLENKLTSPEFGQSAMLVSQIASQVPQPWGMCLGISGLGYLTLQTKVKTELTLNLE